MTVEAQGTEKTLAEQLRERLQANPSRPASARPGPVAGVTETPEQYEARIMNTPDAWTCFSAGQMQGSILPR